MKCKHKVKRFISLVLALMLCCSAASAVDISLYGTEFSEEKVFVSDIAESGHILYFLMTDSQTGGSDLIIAAESGFPLRVRWRITADDPVLLGYFFIGMEPREDGSLLALLWNYQKYLLVVFQEGKPANIQECYEKPRLAEGMAVWVEDGSFVRWDGYETTKYPIPQSSDSITKFTLWNGSPCFVNRERKTVEKITEDGISETVYTIPTAGELLFADLASCGELLLSYCVKGSEETVVTAKLVCLPQGDTFEGGYSFIGVRRQEDGTTAMRLASWANRGKLDTFFNGLLNEDGLAVSEFQLFTDPDKEITDGYDPSKCVWIFTDCTGCQWKYFLSPPTDGCAVEAVLPDGTCIRYYIDTADTSLALEQWSVKLSVETYLSTQGNTMAPLRSLAVLCGATVDWDGVRNAVTVTKGETTILFFVGSSRAEINGVPCTMKEDAVLLNGKTMVPLRFLAENLGMTVKWEQGTAYLSRQQE